MFLPSPPERAGKRAGGAERPSVILIGATNHMDRLDEALKRPGRFARHIEIRPPAPKWKRG